MPTYSVFILFSTIRWKKSSHTNNASSEWKNATSLNNIYMYSETPLNLAPSILDSPLQQKWSQIYLFLKNYPL